MLVHGALADYRSADSLAARLGAHYRVIRYSRRYHWPNAATVPITDYSPQLHARDLVEFIRALKLPPVLIVAHSYGGLVAVLAAVSAQELVRTLTLAEPATLSIIEGTPEMEARRKQQAEITDKLHKLLNAGKSREAVEEFAEWVRGNDGGFVKSSSAQR